MLLTAASSSSSSSRREWDDVWRVWSALRGEWLRSGVALAPPPSPTGAAAVVAAAPGEKGSPLATAAAASKRSRAEGELVAGWLAAAENEHAILVGLFPSSPSSPSSSSSSPSSSDGGGGGGPTPSSILTALLAPSLVALKAHLLSHIQTTLRKDPLPWRAFGLFAALTALGPRWTAFFDHLLRLPAPPPPPAANDHPAAAASHPQAAAAVVVGEAADWLVLDGSSSGRRSRAAGPAELAKALWAQCLRAIPEAVESAKVAAPGGASGGGGGGGGGGGSSSRSPAEPTTTAGGAAGSAALSSAVAVESTTAKVGSGGAFRSRLPAPPPPRTPSPSFPSPPSPGADPPPSLPSSLPPVRTLRVGVHHDTSRPLAQNRHA